MSGEILIETPSGEKISALLNRPSERTEEGHDKTLVLMIHGYPGHKYSHNDFFGGIESVLSEGGFHIMRFDLRGCGASDGRSEEITLASGAQDIESILGWARENGYARFGLVAEGLGATLALLSQPENVLFLILAWPVLDPKTFLEQIGKDPEVSENLCKSLQDSLQEFDTTEALKQVDAPVLIMHGAKDRQVPIDQLDFIRKHFQGPRAEITTFEDGTHGLPEETHRRMVLHHTRQFTGRCSARAAHKLSQKA